jgi:hypothetical protein
MKPLKCTARVAAMLAFCLVGCSGGPKVVPSTGPRPATSAELVQLYEKPPHRYERLGEVSVPASADVKWDASANANVGFDRLKEKAAVLGANGLLLHVDSGARDGRVLAGYHGNYYDVSYMNTTPKTFIAEAIYVIEK